jgi:hypothetical protein
MAARQQGSGDGGERAGEEVMDAMEYEPQWFKSPLNLPERKSGKVSIKHRVLKAGEETPVVGMRQAVLRGIKPVFAKLKEPMRVHELVHKEHGMWMTDLPEELNQIGELLYLVQPKGRVCIGGLGLGLLARAVADRTVVDEIVVVEIDKHVIKLCKQPGYDVVNDDIMHYLQVCESFDYFLLDTWQATSAAAWWTQVMPMKRMIRQRFGLKPFIHCWAEDIMIGQIYRSLVSSPPHWYYSGLPMPMKHADAEKFIRNVGLPTWEKKYGAIVDANMKREK